MEEDAAARKAEAERALLLRAQSGDARAFHDLVRPHLDRIRRIAYSFSRNWSDADDLAQEALVKAYRSLAQFEGRAQLSTWLYSVTRSVCLDHLRKGSTKLQKVTQEGHEELSAPEGDPEWHLSQRAGAEALWKCVKELDAEFRLPLVLHVVEGLSYEEVAQLERVPVGTIRSRIARGKEKLKKVLRARGVTP